MPRAGTAPRRRARQGPLVVTMPANVPSAGPPPPSPPSLSPGDLLGINSGSSIRQARCLAGLPVTSPRDPAPSAPPAYVSPPGGWRMRRDQPLTEDDLYNDEARPPVLATPSPHHVCGICLSVKSHPVSYLCGHSHCFVCIRVWLERQWKCPECSQVMHTPPFHHYGEENSIAHDYPFWMDDSRVSYSFRDLIFPQARADLT
ncbi:hypothetical protein K438DRAFT_2141409 [Mycena galopus ATCC 62051]|nr:hypothetical protein K438DRAFT_2141409 [Mycena galopus ATCC 62051]